MVHKEGVLCSYIASELDAVLFVEVFVIAEYTLRDHL